MVWQIEEEYHEIVQDKQWLLLFYKIGQACQAHEFSITEAKKPGNRHLNRYSDVSPYDHTRVKLSRIDKDYINANFVNVPNANRKYILTQGPLFITASHFWLMIWEQKSQGILMLNKLIEKTESKCHQYWPQKQNAPAVFENVNLAVTVTSEVHENYYIVRKFKLQDLFSKETRDIFQFHYITWPDFGVPKSPTQFLEFLNVVRTSGVLDSNVGPAIVHCSAGVGRSGTFCLVDSTLVIMERDGVDSVDIKSVLIDMRKQRMGLIQTPDQLRFSYQAVIEGIKRFDPDYKEEHVEVNHSTVQSHEGSPSPPPLPPRGESLKRILDFLPLPPIPANSYGIDESDDESASSDESVEVVKRQLDHGPAGNAYEGNTAKTIQESPVVDPSRSFISKPRGSEMRGSPKKINRCPFIPLTITISLGVLITGCLYMYYKR